MKKIINLIKNRNFILLFALFAGFLVPDFSVFLKDSTIYVLAIVMTFSVSGISMKILLKYKSVVKITLYSIFLNYIIHGSLILILAYLFFDNNDIFIGFVVIAATPPGVAIIPFTYAYNGDLDYSFKGVLGTYLIAIFLTPLIINYFTGDADIKPIVLIMVMLKVIVIPLILSRFLALKKIKPFVEKVRGKVIDLGFALIIYTAIGLNRDAILTDYDILLKSSIIFIIVLFIIGFLYSFVLKKKVNKKTLISQNLILTVKSSGFAVATALILFDDTAAIPAAIMSIFVLLYLITLNIIHNSK